MTPTLRAFLDGLIDYAGLFPPARLEMPEAVRIFSGLADDPFGFAVARFICPAARLEDLRVHASCAGGNPPWRISLIPRPAGDAVTLVGSMAEDIARAVALESATGGAFRLEAVEVRLPDALADEAPGDALADVFEDLVRPLVGVLPAAGGLFVEAACADSWFDRTAIVIEALARVAARVAPGFALGYKLRCGGLDPAAFPPAARVALTLETCHRAAVPFKATAGLHHPVRARDAALGVVRHGFFNLFGAGILLAGGALDAGRLQDVIDERDARAFAFTEDSLAWRGCEVPLADIVRARRERMISFGSCSVDEPRDDLAALGLL